MLLTETQLMGEYAILSDMSVSQLASQSGRLFVVLHINTSAHYVHRPGLIITQDGMTSYSCSVARAVSRYLAQDKNGHGAPSSFQAIWEPPLNRYFNSTLVALLFLLSFRKVLLLPQLS